MNWAAETKPDELEVPPAHPVPSLVSVAAMIPVVALPNGLGLLPLTLSIAQVGTWTGLGKTKIFDLAARNELVVSRVDGRTLVLTSSVIALIERNRVARAD